MRAGFLGDRVATALLSIGITPDRVSQWVGRPCGCDERKQKLNALDKWARRVLSGQLNKAEQYLNRIMELQ